MSLVADLRSRWRVFLPLLATWGVTLVLLALYFAADPTMFTEPQFGNLALQLTPYVFSTFAQALIMLTGGIDLSIGPVISLVTCIMATHPGDGAVLLALGVGLLVGLWNGAFVSFLRIPAIVVTLANSFVVSGIALYVLPTPGGQVAPGVLNFGSAVALLPVSLWSWLVVLALWGWFKRTPSGLQLYAVGNNEEAARAAGVRVPWARLSAYALAGVFTALAGIALSVQTSTGDPTVGVPYTLSSIAGAVVGGVSFFGGRGTLRGALAGAIILGALTNLLFFLGISQFVQYIVEGLVLIVALVIGQLESRSRAGA
jgi:ribose transport system permease protein